MKNTKQFVISEFERLIREGQVNGFEAIRPALLKLLKNPYNLILLADAYKYSHHKFYGEGLTKMVSYLEARGGMFGHTVFFGLQIFLKEYLSDLAFTRHDVDEAEELLNSEGGVFSRDDVFKRELFDYIIDEHEGRLPVMIKAVKEGTVVNHGNVMMTVEPTDEKCAWLVNFLEPLLLQIWYPITVSTLSREVKKVVTKAFDETSDLYGEAKEMAIQFVLNDFGFRGVSSVQSAINGGMGHLVNFSGSDNTIAIQKLREYYNTQTIYGKSVPATEHSVMTLKGKENEVVMMEKVLDEYPTGLVACVSDTYDIMHAALNLWGGKLRDKVLSRPSNSPLIIRPDSGDVGYTLIKLFEALFEKFGYTTNNEGYKVLPPQVRIIQGDGVNYKSIIEMYELLKEHKISAENLALGMGGKLLQADINRDTHKFATKACYAIIDGEEINTVKSPVVFDAEGNRHMSFKKSKQGLLKLVKNGDGTFRTVTSLDDDYDSVVDELQIVFKDGVLYNETTFEEVRERAALNEFELA
jgi:nicotinamide phosphoribosyltransferase